MEQFKDSTFEEQIKTDKLVVVDFWASWCVPCKSIAPILEELSKEFESVLIGKLNVEEEPATSAKFGIRNIPTLIFIKNGDVIDKMIGLQSKIKIAEKITELSK